MHPVIFQLFVSAVVVALSPVVLLWEDEFQFTWWGFVGAGLWAPSNVLAVAVVRNIGVSLGAGMWAAAIVIVSFGWGAFGAPVWGGADCTNMMENPPLAIVGMFFVVMGIGAMSWYAQYDDPRAGDEGGAEGAFQRSARRGSLQKLLTGGKDPEEGRSARKGAAMAMLLGAMSGSIMVPLKIAQSREGIDGPLYAMSFALAVPCWSLLMVAVYVVYAFQCGKERPRLMLRKAHLPLMTGALWTIGSLGSVYAVSSPLGLTVGYPMTQLSTLISTFWGVAYFKEVRGGANIAAFVAASMLSVGGSVLLVIFGTCDNMVPIAP